ncbi:hypothetical protein SAMN05216218_12624, partial [Halorientalis regularis]
MLPAARAALAREQARPYYEDAVPAHGIFHATRVRDAACQLATQHPVTVDQERLAVAAWRHDIGRPRERVGEVVELPTAKAVGFSVDSRSGRLIVGRRIASVHV